MSLSLPPPFRLQTFERIDSTNDEAKRQANAGAPAFTFILADEQSAGRGRRGNSWVSPPGNLYCSLLLRPACAPADAAQLSFAAALAVAETAERLPPGDAEIACKWPNDVLASGRKIAGILLESQARGGALDFLVIGIGVNLAAHPAETAWPASSLKALGAEVTADTFLPILGARLLAWYDAWRGEGFAPLRRAWLARAWGMKRSIRVRLPEGEIDGSFDGLDEAGRLLLGTSAGPRTIAAGEVFPA